MNNRTKIVLGVGLALCVIGIGRFIKTGKNILDTAFAVGAIIGIVTDLVVFMFSLSALFCIFLSWGYLLIPIPIALTLLKAKMWEWIIEGWI